VSRLLFLLPSVPDPPDSGAKLRNLMLLRLAREEHHVAAIAFGRPDEATRLAALGEPTRVLQPPPSRGPWQRASAAAGTDLPDMAQRLWSSEFARAVRCWQDDVDLVQAEGIEMARYLSAVPRRKRVYDAHNAEFLLQRRASEAAATPLAKLYSRVQWRRLERFERRVVQGSRLILAVSHHDANQLRALAGGSSVAMVPNAIQASAYSFRLPQAEDPPNLLFVGKLDYRPNAEALAWLLESVLPRIFGVLPGARLFAVGANPPEWLVAAGQRDARIAVTGHVADERPYLARCSALLLPVHVAAGSRLKALVAMASGLPIVSTALGMEGLDAEPDVAYVRAESADDWVNEVRKLLDDTGLRANLARHARALVEQRYDWTRVRPLLRAAYQA
jgi:polysaccharide biosynthesis protein PslH